MVHKNVFLYYEILRLKRLHQHMLYIIHVSKTFHFWFAITLTHVNAFWYFCSKVINKVSNQNCFIEPPQITCASALPDKIGKTQKSHFSLKWCISFLTELNQSLLDFSIFLTHDSHFKLLHVSLNLVINAFIPWLLGGMVQEKESWECRSSWTLLRTQYMCTDALSPERKKNVICDVW